MTLQKSFTRKIKPQKSNLRHLFGGAALIMLMVQMATGLYMMFYYEPGLEDTYKSIQYLTNETLFGSFSRNTHRYTAFFLVVVAFFHLVRSFYRGDYLGRGTNWIIGVCLFLLILTFTVTGAILPWEWKGYWIMEMVVNLLRSFPLMGGELGDFFMDAYTPMRNFIIHDIFLPITAMALLEYHCLKRLKKRGFGDYMLGHLLIVLPVMAVVAGLVIEYPIPTRDPAVIPMPLEGRFIPAPEWFFVSFLIPFRHVFKNNLPIFTFYIPLAVVVLTLAVPRIHRRKWDKRPVLTLKKALLYLPGTVLILFLFFGTIYGSHDSPWAGCNCCHNVSMGERMGIPPITFKDRNRNPLLENNKWMMLHWYEPQVTW